MDHRAITGLRAGVLLSYTACAVTESSSVNDTYHVAVLRVERDGELHLSLPWTGSRPVSRPDTFNNPYRVTTMGDLVNRHGVTSEWFPRASQQLAAQALVREYEKIPRREHVRRDVLSGTGSESIDAFMRGPVYPILVGIVRNGESGSYAEQWASALRVIGMSFTVEQLVAILVCQELMKNFPSDQ